MEILFEDNHLIIFNKPAGLLTQPSGTAQSNLEDQAKLYIKEKYQKPGNVFLHAVHRLDKAVGGIVVFAKTSKALSRLNQMMRSHEMIKRYRAFVSGKTPVEGVLEHYLIHDDFYAKVVQAPVHGAKLCRLRYRLVKFEASTSLIEIDLETGRYHQIRAQLAAVGHSIIGDRKYGNAVSLPGEIIALQHHYLELNHPVSQKRIKVALSCEQFGFNPTA